MAPHPHYSESPDAKLIALAEEIIVLNATRETIPNDADCAAVTRRVFDKVETLTGMTPRTAAGLRAKARAAAAIAEIDADGNFPGQQRQN